MAGRQPDEATAPLVAQVPERLAEVRTRIERAGGDPRAITVVAVTKGHGVAAVRACLAAGLSDIGENYAAELLSKASEIEELAPWRFREGSRSEDSPPRWHFLGSIQRNKVARLAGVVGVWQSVARRAEIDAICSAATAPRIFIQVNVDGRVGRGGCAPGDAAAVVEHAAARGAHVEGLMVVAPDPDPESTRRAFRLVAGIAGSLGLTGLSMGMSGDLEIAVQEGASVLRIGSSLLGPRQAPA